MRKKLKGLRNFDYVAVTMTAELSDYFRTKAEGVKKIVAMCLELFKEKVYFLTNSFEILTFEEVKDLMSLAGANWCSTSWLVSKLERRAILIDVGSTTTDIIPINEKPVPQGLRDEERLASGELVYTGALRTNLCSIVSRVPFRGKELRVSSELFSLSGDMHLILGHIKEEDYTTETADKRGKSFREAINRVAHLICMDENLVSEQEIIQLCNYIYQKQLDQIKEAIIQVLSRVKFDEFNFVLCGLGKDFLGRRALEQLSYKNIKDMSSLIGYDASLMAPSFSLCFMLLEKLGKLNLEEWFRF